MPQATPAASHEHPPAALHAPAPDSTAQLPQLPLAAFHAQPLDAAHAVADDPAAPHGAHVLAAAFQRQPLAAHADEPAAACAQKDVHALVAGSHRQSLPAARHAASLPAGSQTAIGATVVAVGASVTLPVVTLGCAVVAPGAVGSGAVGASLGASDGAAEGASLGADVMQPATPASTNSPPEQAVQAPAALQAVHSVAVATEQQLPPAQSPSHSPAAEQPVPGDLSVMHVAPER